MAVEIVYCRGSNIDKLNEFTELIEVYRITIKDANQRGKATTFWARRTGKIFINNINDNFPLEDVHCSILDK